MAKTSDISWGSYNEHEGPFYKGKIQFKLQRNPTINDKRLAAIVSVEGGMYDAINMYDRMILSAGLIQWGEANNFFVTKLLGFICDSGLEHIVKDCLTPALEYSGSSLKKNSNGIWRFFIGDVEVNSLALQQKLFLGCDGRKKSWTDENQKFKAKLWASCIASILEDPLTYEIQKKFTVDRLTGFVSSDVKKILFDDKTSTPWAEATRAIYLTFAVNLPRVAGEMFRLTKFVGKKWSEQWCMCLIKKLTFGAGIKIYPGRYNTLRPIIEDLFDVHLPIDADHLSRWNAADYNEHEPNTQNENEKNSINLNNDLIEELNRIVIIEPAHPVQQQDFMIVKLFKDIFSFFKKFLV